MTTNRFIAGIKEALASKNVLVSDETIQDIVENIKNLHPTVFYTLFLTERSEKPMEGGIYGAVPSQDNWDIFYKSVNGLSRNQKKVLIEIFRNVNPKTETINWEPKKIIGDVESNAVSNTLKRLKDRGLVICETNNKKIKWNRTIHVRLTILGYIAIRLLSYRKKPEKNWGDYR